jgi:hypothetical protein
MKVWQKDGGRKIKQKAFSSLFDGKPLAAKLTLMGLRGAATPPEPFAEPHSSEKSLAIRGGPKFNIRPTRLGSSVGRAED